MKLRGIVAGALALGIALLSSVAMAQVNPGTSPLSIPKGGTGASTAAGARANLGIGQTSPGDVMQNGTLVASVTSNNLTVALKTLTGADPSVGSPVTACYRNATIATGDYTCINATAATSITVNAGSTFQVANATPFHLWVGLFNDAGTLRLGLYQSAAAGVVNPIDMYNVKSSTACAACSTATAAGVWYTPVAVASKAFRLAGLLEWSSGLATAGTYASVPTKIQLYHPGIPLPGTPVQTVSGIYNEGQTLSSATHTNTTIDAIAGAGTARLQVGMGVTGTNVAANTVITAITSGTAITVNNATTGSATNPLTYSWVVSNATTTFANGPMSASITLTSPAHSVAINYCMGTVASAASVEAFTSASRGGVQVLPTFSGAFSTAGVAVVPSCGGGSEMPGSAGPFTYNFIFKSSAATSVSVCDNNGGCNYRVEEVAQ